MTDERGEGEIQVLSTEECYELLATQEVGRLGVVAQHYPVVLPVNYALDNGVVVVRTDSGTLLSSAVHQNVAFEVDALDPHSRSGWSVLVQGLAEEVTDHHRDALVERTHASGVSPWAPGERGHWVRVIPHHVSGRRVVAGQLPWPSPESGYL